METTANTSYHTRAFAQVTGLALFLLECLYKVSGYLSGMCYRAFVRVVCRVSILYAVLITLADSLLQVTERSVVMGFTPIKAHNRKYALFTGSAVAADTLTSFGQGLVMLKKRETSVPKKYDEHEYCNHGNNNE